MALGKSLTVLPVTQTSSNIRTEIEGILAKTKINRVQCLKWGEDRSEVDRARRSEVPRRIWSINDSRWWSFDCWCCWPSWWLRLLRCPCEADSAWPPGECPCCCCANFAFSWWTKLDFDNKPETTLLWPPTSCKRINNRPIKIRFGCEMN